MKATHPTGRLTLDEARTRAAQAGLRHGGYCAMPHPTDPTMACDRRPWEHERPGEADQHIDGRRYTVPGDVLSPHPSWDESEYAT
ncbi:hypothetical protein [Streptomyces sp. UH6]|uniref:hypothetical protein n=1 Tax=Streptomyces sp. UH6 TaxID=2748379 RepID=UPI0015D47B71|nr:hypothetical protein [Streptomyces sp. UH6]NYV73001.1 hypothetical protein [Streptomyces sp. UH6]